jgi:hypothetical protein
VGIVTLLLYPMTATLEFDFPASLLLRAKDEAALRERSRFLLALKYFEMEELSSGQAATLCGMDRVAFLLEAARCGVPAFDLSADEIEREFANG